MAMPSLTPQEFVAKWTKSTLKERSAAQEHFIDVCHLIGHPTPAEADPTGQHFTFEAGVNKQRGGQGWADVWKKGYFAWEYKGKHTNLDKAYQQLLQYREALQNPPLLIVSDMEQIEIHTNFTNTIKHVIVLCLHDLVKPESLAKLRAVFFEPQAFLVPQTTEQVTEHAAKIFTQLADILRKQQVEPLRAAHFLIQLLFCLFAEDVGLLPKELFTQLIRNTQKKPAIFNEQLKQLFKAMSTGGWFGFQEIAHIDGRLFDNDATVELDEASLDILAHVCSLDWSNIEPSIFGTLFERSLDPGKRAQLGAQYTSKDDILLIIEPVLMRPLRRRWEEVQRNIRELSAKRENTSAKGSRTKLQNEINALLRRFADEISQVQVLDPACGSGNFLYVALKQLLDLEKEVIVLSSEVGGGGFFPTVSPLQLHGIETNEYAYELAQATIWIGFIQWLRENGFGMPKEPILKPLEAVLHQDAILTYDGLGNPREPEWPEVDVVIGNPPFLGNKRMRKEMGDVYVKNLRQLYGDRLSGGIDLVCYWFEKARAMIEAGKLQRAGLLATQAIRGGVNRTVLERIKETGNIFWAQSDRDWILEGAAVHISMVGFDNGNEKVHELDGNLVEVINPDLSSSSDLTQAKILSENKGLAFQGPVKIGSFDIDSTIAHEMLTLPNPHGKPNSEVIRPWINGLDITRRPQNMYIIDFNAMPLEQASLYEAPFEHIHKYVKPERDKNRRPRRREYWWQHGETVPGLRKAIAPLNRFICTPRIAKYRLFIWVKDGTLPDSAVIAIAREDDYFLGVLQSKPHELWTLRRGTALETRPRYTPTTTFETFPFPWPPGQEPHDDERVQAIAAAAKQLVELRENWLNPQGMSEKDLKKRTLTNLYNQRPTWLQLAHDALDKAVLDAYGWPHDIQDEEILKRLLDLNLQRAGSEKHRLTA
ncbi:hypothetical protein U27_02343 [Candidatus Vecturithrix granuli]|uniref:site-specific DNA-methyltransferase (adenine-specific) n=1 Tax=Vecturithrix granuli TaxID=1499967 RepID=A0A0S6W753_VECG1|nr:hypothetical protein U27_02343 [Candidatus Vecturithrix granuli]